MLCASCGLQVSQDFLCPHHAYSDDNWAAANRIMCDFFHRHKELGRLGEADRFDTNIPSTPPEQNVATYAEGYE